MKIFFSGCVGRQDRVRRTRDAFRVMSIGRKMVGRKTSDCGVGLKPVTCEQKGRRTR